MEEKIGADLVLAELKRDNLWKAYEKAHQHASSVLVFTIQWKDLEEHLDSTHKSLEKGLEELVSREKRAEEARREVEEREREVGLKEKMLGDLHERVSDCYKEILVKEQQLGLVQNRIEECSEELNLKNQELGVKEEQLETVEMAIEKCSRKVELKQKQLFILEQSIQERSKELEVSESQLRKVKNELEEGSKVLKLGDDQVAKVQELLEERSRELNFKKDKVGHVEKLFEVRCAELTSKEGELEQVARSISLKEEQLSEVEKLLADRSAKLSLKDKELVEVQKLCEEQSKDVALRTKQLEELSQELTLKKSSLGAVLTLTEKKSTELRSLEKNIDSLKTVIRDCNERLEGKQKQLEEVQKAIEECSRKSASKNKEYELLTKSVEERCAKLRSKQKESELFEKSLEKSRGELRSKEKEYEVQWKSLEKSSEELRSKEKEYEVNQKSLDNLFAELRSKEKEYEVSIKSLDELCGELRSKEKEYELNKKSLDKSGAELRSKEKEYEQKRTSLEEPYAESGSKEKKLDTMVDLLNSLSKEIERRKEQLVSIEEMIKKYSEDAELKERDFKAIQRSIEEHNEELKSKEKKLQSIQMSIENHDKELRQKREEHDSVQKSILECSTVLESKVKDLNSVQKSLTEQSDELESKVMKLNSAQKAANESLKALELKEKNFDSIRRLIEENSRNLQMEEKKFEENVKEFKLKEMQFELICKSAEERIQEVESKEKKLDTINTSPVKNLPLRELLLNNKIDSLYTSPESLASIDGKTLQLFINKHLTMHDIVRGAISAAFGGSSDPAKLVLDAMQGFYPHSGEGSVQFDSSIVKRSCILILEQLMRFSPQIKPQVMEEARMVAHQWKSRMLVEYNSLDVLAFLQLLAAYGLSSMLNSEELRSLIDMVTQHRQVSQLRKAFNFKEMPTNSIIPCAQIKMEEQENVSQVPEPSAPVSLLSVLEEDHAEAYDILANKISNALKTTLDPALVVLGVLKRSCHQQWENGLKSLKESIMTRYVLVLELLIRASSPIASHVKEEAEKLAINWKTKLRNGFNCYSEALVFLHFLAAYGLMSSFNREEILKLFLTVAHHCKTPELRQAIGVSCKISDYIEDLIAKKQNLEAIAFIYAFQLGDKFSNVLLLQKYLQNAKKWVKGIRRRGNKDLAIEKEVAALQAAAKCMSDYKLDSKPLSNLIERCMKELQRQKDSLRNNETAPSESIAGAKDKVQRSVNSAAPATMVHRMQNSTPSAAIPATGIKLQKKPVKVKMEGTSISPSKYHAKQQNGNDATPPAVTVQQPQISGDKSKQQIISDAKATVIEAKLQHKAVKKELGSTSAFKDQAEQPSCNAVGSSFVERVRQQQKGVEGITTSASKDDYSLHQNVVLKSATPAIYDELKPRTMKRDFHNSFSSKKYAKWERAKKRHRSYTVIRPHTSMAPGTNQHEHSSAWQPHVSSGMANEGSSNFALPPGHAQLSSRGGWPNRHPGKQFSPPRWHRH